jgi:hypothetical protein
MAHQKLELTWIGKDQRPRLEPRILLEDPARSYHARQRVTDQDLFDNRLIKGDNLLALKALEAEFSGKVKCVFIDPPYNTGSAFAHYDDGLEHSIWLGLMRDRLEIIRRLLSDDGSLWITIDDNEAHYLKVLCDEVFGRPISFGKNLIRHETLHASFRLITTIKSHQASPATSSSTPSPVPAPPAPSPTKWAAAGSWWSWASTATRTSSPVPRLQKVIDGRRPRRRDAGHRLAGRRRLSLLRAGPHAAGTDRWGNLVINPEYDAAMLSAAMCKLEGFAYAPSETLWWQHGHSSERDFIYVTTQTLSAEQLDALADEVGTERSLLVCCGAYRGVTAAQAAQRWQHLTIKKIPKMVKDRCEWGHDDYSLNVANLPMAVPHAGGL